MRRQSSHPTAAASPSLSFHTGGMETAPRILCLAGLLLSEPCGLPSRQGCSVHTGSPQSYLPVLLHIPRADCPGVSALVQPEERAENQRFPSLQRRMSAEDEGRTTLPRVLLALPGERLRHPDTSSSLLLYYSPSCLFVGFLHLTVCLIHVIGGLLPLPARPPEPNSLPRFIY